MSFLLDTNVVSEIMHPEPEACVLQWLETNQAECFLSVITLGELEKGLETLPAGKKKKRLLKAYEGFLESAEERILASISLWPAVGRFSPDLGKGKAAAYPSWTV